MPKSIKIFLSLFVVFSLFLFGFINKSSDIDGSLEKITAALARWNAQSPYEKVYLHTDRGIYSVGDTLWFKAYVTGGATHKLSTLSGSLYVDLINEDNKIERSLKLPLSIGMAAGSIELTAILKEGNYRLKAYTEWMRNAGADYFYDHTFSILNTSASINTNVSYQTIKKDDKKLLLAVVDYKNQEGEPLADKKVDCVIKFKDKSVIRHYTTNAAGKIIVELPADQKQTFLETKLWLEDKREFTKNIAVKPQSFDNDIQFFPEGGNLLGGFNQLISFKAIAPDGLGIEVSGRVIDEQQKEIVTFKSTHLGMGSFNFIPKQGMKYQAEISYPDGSSIVKDLPAATNEGIALAIYNRPGDSILVRIYASKTITSVNKKVNLIAQTGGELAFAAKVILNRPMTSIWVEKKRFPTGIAQFTLFDEKIIPLNERLVFVDNKDRLKLNIAGINPSQITREKMELDVKVTDSRGEPVIGSFSVAVVAEQSNHIPENKRSTILSNVLLTSDIKGYVEQPNYYFNPENKEAADDLDNLMLTQGYRRFVWKEILQDTLRPPQYKVEKHTTISGKLLTLSGKPVAKGKVLIFSPQTTIKDTITDEQGRFRFDVIVPDGIKFNVQGRTATNSDKVQVVIDKQTAEPVGYNKNYPNMVTAPFETLQSYIKEKQQEHRILQKLGKLNEVQQLEQVDIKAKPTKSVGNLGGFSVPEVSADQIYIPDAAANYGNAWMCLQGRLRGVVFAPKGRQPIYPQMTIKGVLNPMLVVVDGSKIDSTEVSDFFNTMDISDIQKVMVLRSSIQVHMLDQDYFSALIIQTNRGFTRKSYTSSMAFITPKGYSLVKQFYSPKHDKSNDSNEVDFRKTVYWNPDMRTDKEGKVRVVFYNADTKGRYKITIEGISGPGNLGRLVTSYEVH